MHLKKHKSLSPNKHEKEESGRPLKIELPSKDVLIDNEDDEILTRLLSLEGECKIQTYQFIKFNLVKTILTLIPIIISVVFLFCLKYSIPFRVGAFYDRAKEEDATHLYIKGNYKAQEIVQIKSKNPIRFIYKKLAYIIDKNQTIPQGYKYEKHFQNLFSERNSKNGLLDFQVEKHKQLYGKNQHNIQIPSYGEYMLDVLTTPFFLLQYIFCIIFILENFIPFAVALLTFSFIGITINYIMLYISFDKIKMMAERKIIITVLRNGQKMKIDSVDLVPGDVFEPQQEIPCDALVLKGDVYVNEANLTGQSYPIGKFPVTNSQSIKLSNRWLYQGSKVFEARSDCLAIVINTGFQTFRGRIIRRILSREVKEPDLFRSALVFILQILIITIASFFGILPILLEKDIEPLFIVFQFFNFLSTASPPPLPIFFNIAYSFSLSRLKLKDITGTQPEKTIDGAYLKTMCFDKTGTLTQVNVEIKRIMKVQENGRLYNIMDSIQRKENLLVKKIFACCHTVKEVDDEILGDEIDKELYLFSEYKMESVENPLVKFLVEGKDGDLLEVFRINQFESKFQSMSVLVRDVFSDTFYIFVKGAPEKMQRNSVNRLNKYDETIEQLCLSGYRTISFGYKVVEKEDLERIAHVDRQVFEQNLTLLGVVGFENKLKKDAKQTMKKLFSSNIDPKMITGDNLFVAVQTGTRAGIVKRETPIIILEGEKQPRNADIKNRKFYGTVLTRTKNRSSSKQIELSENDTYLTQSLPIAVDNSFLTLNPPPFLTKQIVLFARIPPENKALIIKKYKENILQKIEETQSGFQKFLKKDLYKVGMCGDGANDLLALKEADLSLGIQESDASYGSSFTIKKLLDVDEIIRQSKCTQANIIQLFEYYTATSMFGLYASVIMINDVTYFSTASLMFFSFTCTLLMPVLFSFSRPAKKPTKYTPEGNFMCLHNHLIFWGNMIIPLIGVVCGYFYFFETDEYIPNPDPSAGVLKGFNSKTHTATIVLLMVLLPFNFNALFIYSGYPWKQKFYGNVIFAVLLVINIGVATLFYFITYHLASLFQFEPISIENSVIVLVIMLGSIVVGYLYNIFVRACKLDHKILE